MIPQVKIWTREEMMQRVAPFAALKGFSDGLQDSALPESQKTTFNVIGFQTPESAGQGAVNSPVGQTACANAAIKISEGFNLGFERIAALADRVHVPFGAAADHGGHCLAFERCEIVRVTLDPGEKICIAVEGVFRDEKNRDPPSPCEHDGDGSL